MSTKAYPIGTPGQKWTEVEKKEWFNAQSVKRSYKEEVLDKIMQLDADFEIIKYGNLPLDEEKYPLYLLKSKNWDDKKQNVLITGGVHGYETSGVQGAIRFAKENVKDFNNDFNFIIATCVSPWGYETINRWNPYTVDPNRSFKTEGQATEALSLMKFVNDHDLEFICHIDLHETTDTDASEFRPALAARDGKSGSSCFIPDGFYLVGDSENPMPEFQKAMIEGVREVTHIAPADQDNKLIGVDLEQEGVINYPAKEAGLCMGLTNAKYVTTTEVYPDSENATEEICIEAQVAAIVHGLKFIKR